MLHLPQAVPVQFINYQCMTLFLMTPFLTPMKVYLLAGDMMLVALRLSLVFFYSVRRSSAQ